MDLPVRYAARVYGAPSIDRFAEASLLLCLAIAGYRRLWMKPVEL